MSYLAPAKSSRALASRAAERALIAVIRADLEVIAERSAAEQLEDKDLARAKMRERALAREAARRQSRKSAVPPAIITGRKRHA